MKNNAETQTDAGDSGISHFTLRKRHSGARGIVDTHQRSVTPVPASIIQSICAIKRTLSAIKKSQRNQHGGYNFSSTDDIYAALTHKMGEVGLVLFSQEDSAEVVRIENKDGKPVQWLRVVYSFVWATETDTWSDQKARRTLFVQITGPQTFQAAQSFVEKAYLRSTFKMPSGDMDLDAMPQDELDDTEATPKIKRPSSYAKKGRNGKDADAKARNEKEYNDLLSTIRACVNTGDLRALWMDHAALNGESWSDWPGAWAQILQDEYELRMEDLAAQEAA